MNVIQYISKVGSQFSVGSKSHDASFACTHIILQVQLQDFLPYPQE